MIFNSVKKEIGLFKTYLFLKYIIDENLKKKSNSLVEANVLLSLSPRFYTLINLL